METKKCPKCGAEIPVEMSFCLHCMERTDGVLEIKKKAAPNRKLTAAVIIIFVLMTAVTILLILQFIGRNGSKNNESAIPQKTTNPTTEYASLITPDTASTSAAATEKISTEIQTTTVSSISTKSTDAPESKTNANVSDNDNETEVNSSEINSDEENNETDPPVQASENVNQPSEEFSGNENTTSSKINFEEVFTLRMNGWGASHVLADTLSFSENGCTFTSNVGMAKVNCTVSANADMTDFTLTIEPATEYTSYSTAIYIPDIVNEITYFVLDYRMSSSMRTDIGLMFENFESDGSFAENELHCDISTQAHNGGSYPITINCRVD